VNGNHKDKQYSDKLDGTVRDKIAMWQGWINILVRRSDATTVAVFWGIQKIDG